MYNKQGLSIDSPLFLLKRDSFLVFTVLSLFAVNAYPGQKTAADKKKCNPQCGVAVISGRCRLLIVFDGRFHINGEYSGSRTACRHNADRMLAS